MRHTSPPAIEGTETVVNWFGEWPCFHDCEILQLHINRGGTSALRIDPTGSPGREPHRVIVFEFSGITSLRIQGEDADVQNVISGLDIDRERDGVYRLGWDSLFGIGGEVTVAQLRVRLE